MSISLVKKLKLSLLLKSALIGCGLFLIGLLLCISSNIYAVQEFGKFFNNPTQILRKIYTQKEIHIPHWSPIPVLITQKPDLIILNLGKVSSFTCRKLLKTNFPFPHQFRINNQLVDSQSAYLCGYISPKPISFIFHTGLRSFAHLLFKPNECDTSYKFNSLGICTNTCLNFEHCETTAQPHTTPTR